MYVQQQHRANKDPDEFIHRHASFDRNIHLRHGIWSPSSIWLWFNTRQQNVAGLSSRRQWLYGERHQIRSRRCDQELLSSMYRIMRSYSSCSIAMRLGARNTVYLQLSSRSNISHGYREMCRNVCR